MDAGAGGFMGTPVESSGGQARRWRAFTELDDPKKLDPDPFFLQRGPPLDSLHSIKTRETPCLGAVFPQW